MAIAKAIHPQSERRLDLQQVLTDLVADRLVTQETASRKAKPECIANTMMAPSSMNSVSLLTFRVSMFPP